MSVEAVEEAPVKETEILEPDYSVRYQQVGKDEHAQTYAQKPLSFFGKMELFSLLGGAVNKALKDGDLSIAEIFDAGDRGSITVESVREADTFIIGITKIVEFVPDFLKDLYCIALNVPKGEREYTKMRMEATEDDGGLSDDDAIAILDTFVEQNWEAMQDFFVKKIMPLAQKVSSKAQNTASSKPLKATRQRTPKR